MHGNAVQSIALSHFRAPLLWGSDLFEFYESNFPCRKVFLVLCTPSMASRVAQALRLQQCRGVSALMVGEVVGSFLVGYYVLPDLIQNYVWLAAVKGQSMQPTLNPCGDFSEWVLMNKWAIKDLQKVERGKVYALVDPEDETQMIIKRVIGLYPDVLRTDTRGLETVPPGHCWIEGDNHSVAIDSNTYGAVPLGLVSAYVPCVVWPFSSWRWLHSKVPRNRYVSPFEEEHDPAEDVLHAAQPPEESTALHTHDHIMPSVLPSEPVVPPTMPVDAGCPPQEQV